MMWTFTLKNLMKENMKILTWLLQPSLWKFSGPSEESSRLFSDRTETTKIWKILKMSSDLSFGDCGDHNIIKSGDQYCLLIIAVVTQIFVVNSIDFRDLVVGSTTCLLFLVSVRSRSPWPAAAPASRTLWRTWASGHLLTKMVQAAQDPASHSDLQLPSLVIPGERRKAVKVQLLEAPQPTLPRVEEGPPNYSDHMTCWWAGLAATIQNVYHDNKAACTEEDFAIEMLSKLLFMLREDFNGHDA